MGVGAGAWIAGHGQGVGCTASACVGVADWGTSIWREARLIIPEQLPQRLASTIELGGSGGRVVERNAGDLALWGRFAPFRHLTRLVSNTRR
jgi:hypothetical protein